MPYKVWTIGEEVLAADFNPYLQEQVTATFPNAAARDAALTAPKPGQQAWLADVGLVVMWTGSAWMPIPGQVIAYAESSANGPSTAQSGQSTLLSISFTMPALTPGRRVKLEGFVPYFQAVGATTTSGVSRLDIYAAAARVGRGRVYFDTGVAYHNGLAVAYADNTKAGFAAGTAIAATLRLDNSTGQAIQSAATATELMYFTAAVV